MIHKLIELSIVALAVTAGAGAYAHPGHIEGSPASTWHFLAEHAPPFVLIAAVAIVIGAMFARRPSDR